MDRDEFKKKLSELKELFEEGLLDEETYKNEQKELLIYWRNTSSNSSPRKQSDLIFGSDILSTNIHPPLRQGHIEQIIPKNSKDKPDFHVGMIINDRYELRKLLGQGGMGKVFYAFDKEMAEACALKTLLPEMDDNEDLRRRFVNELRLTRRLSHPNIVRTYALQQDHLSKRWFFTMEYLQGKTLEEILKGSDLSSVKNHLPIDTVMLIIRGLVEALSYAHREGVIHRDLKPANIMLLENSQIKLMDFGIAKATSHTHITKHTAFIGSYFYMAPEQIHGETATFATDIFSLGVLTYEMFSGKVPTGRFEPLSEITDLTNEIDKVVSRAMSLHPSERYQNVEEFENSLIKAIKNSETSLKESNFQRHIPSNDKKIEISCSDPQQQIRTLESSTHRPTAQISSSIINPHNEQNFADNNLPHWLPVELLQYPSATHWEALLGLVNANFHSCKGDNLFWDNLSNILKGWPNNLKKISNSWRAFHDFYLKILSLASHIHLEVDQDVQSLIVLFSSLNLSHITHLTLENHPSIHRLLKKEIFTNLQSLTIHQGYYFSSIMDLLDSSVIYNLEELDLSSCDIYSDQLIYIIDNVQIPSLQRLYLRDNHICSKAIQKLVTWSTFSNLTEIDLSSNPIKNNGAKALAESSVPNLRKLNLSDCSITSHGAKALAESKHLSKLEQLRVNNNEIKASGVMYIFTAPYVSNLTHLSISFDSTIVFSNSKGDQLNNLRNIESLYLDGIQGSDIQIIFMPNRLSNLKFLSIDNIQNECIKYLMHSNTLSNLISLDLSENKLNDEAFLVAMSNLYSPLSLKTLDLSHNKLTSAFIAVLAKSGSFRNISSLNLAYNQIDDEGAYALSQSTYFSELTSLNLYGNKITLDGIRSLVESPNLKKLKRLRLTYSSEEKLLLKDFLQNNSLPKKNRRLYLDTMHTAQLRDLAKDFKIIGRTTIEPLTLRELLAKHLDLEFPY